MYICDLTSKVPKDWTDDKKYLNKRMTTSWGKMGDFAFIKEVWEYDSPDGSNTFPFIFVRCPNCGSYHIKSETYNNLRPEALAGSAGIRRTCKDCGHLNEEAQIVS